MNIVVIDAQGGRIGSAIISGLTAAGITGITAVGTNSAATAAMLKAGAERGATGENPVAVACRSADIILGPIGIIAADALLGEVTPAMAAAVARSGAKKILIPMNRCNITVAGVREQSLTDHIFQAVELAAEYAGQGS